jgi:cell filamentation protein
VNPSPYAYDNGTLINKLGLQDDARLQDAEAAFSAMRRMQMLAGMGPQNKEFDLEHLKAIHKHLFQDVYEWAGTTRGELTTIEGRQFQPPLPLSKGETSFARADQIAFKMDFQAQWLDRQDHLRGLTREVFADKAAELLGAINNLHAFREGNGRTQREFMGQLGEQAGHKLDFSVVTATRMQRDSIAVSEHGRYEGFQTMFREIADRQQVSMMKDALRLIRELDLDPQRQYLTVAQPGKQYEGEVADSTSRIALLTTADNQLIVTHPQNLQRAVQTEHGVRFTAQHVQSMGLEM